MKTKSPLIMLGTLLVFGWTLHAVRCHASSMPVTTTTMIQMPGARPQRNDQYLCHAMKVDTEAAHYILSFKPNSTMHKAHHMLLFTCTIPGSLEDIWDCGEMSGSAGSNLYTLAPVCNVAEAPQIIYGWARDAPALKLPEGVGFKVGLDTPAQFLVLQVHYMHPLKEEDHSGVQLESTTTPMPKTAGVFLLESEEGTIQPHSNDTFDIDCKIEEDLELHPFAFRVHAHDRGKVVSGFKVQRRYYGIDEWKDEWELIGKRNPKDPQMFYPVANPNMVIRQDDYVAARCVMENKEDRPISIGSTGADEMCNFYMMYWVYGDRTLTDNICGTAGPPLYYWHFWPIPKEANELY